MGAISNVADEGVINKINYVSDFDLMLMWKNMDAIVRYVDKNFYEYMKITVGDIQDDRVWYAASANRIMMDFIAPWLEGLQETLDWQMSVTLHVEGAFWEYILKTLGIVYNSTYTTYALSGSGWINGINTKIQQLEDRKDNLTQDQLDKLLFVVDNFDHIKAMVEGDIEHIIDEVMGKIQPEMEEYVNKMVAPFDNRLQIVESTLNKTQFWFWDMLLDIWAFLAGGSIIPIDQIQDAMITIGEWFIDEIFAITDPLEEHVDDMFWALGEHILESNSDIREAVLEEIAKIDTLTQGQEQEVIGLIDFRIADVGGGVGPPGPPGPMGSIGPAGPAGPAGPPGEGEAADINTINQELYTKLWNADAITTNTVTGVMDWMLFTYGERFGDLQEQITPITEFFTDETKLALTELVDMFGSPEAIISFLIPESEGQEAEVLDLMQILISMTFERGT